MQKAKRVSVRKPAQHLTWSPNFPIFFVDFASAHVFDVRTSPRDSSPHGACNSQDDVASVRNC